MADQPSEAGEADVAALFERLRREVRSPPPATTGSTDGFETAWTAARQTAERAWPVSAERPLARRPGWRGRVRVLALTPIKLTVRKLARWYVEPLAADQRTFNAAALNLIDQLADRTAGELDRLERALAATEASTRLVPELELRLTRLERRPQAEAPAAPAAAPSAARPQTPGPDYFAVEARMRGSTVDIRGRQARYVSLFLEASPVLDVGCGRGEFMGLLREAGIDARGVDSSADMVAFCRGEGLDVVHEDALTYLENVDAGSLGGIFAAQLVEHLGPETLVRFLKLAAARLRTGGVLLLETINPLSLIALRHYFADLTHVQPLVPATLELLVRQAGFEETRIEFANEPDERERLRPVVLPDEPAFAAARDALAANVERLNDVVFGPQDYALVARR